MVRVGVLRVHFELCRPRDVPRQAALADKVDQDDAESFKVVPPRMLVTSVRVQRQILGRSYDAFVFLEWDVTARLGTQESLGQAEIDQVDSRGFFVLANENVLRLHISVYEVLGVQVLESLDHLYRDDEDCFQ